MSEYKTWTLFDEDGTYISGSTDGVFEIPSSYKIGSKFKIWYHYGEEDQQYIDYVRTMNCCNCNKLKPVPNETNPENYTYTYPSKNFDLTDIPLAIISAEMGVNINDIEAFKYDEGITDIRIVESNDPVISEALKTFIQTNYGPNVFIIIGSLTETENKRVLKFGYSACDKQCYTISNPLYVYQRCACGMDNCRNEYDDGGVVQDRALYINSCQRGQQVSYNTGDAICVDTLYVKKVEYYTNNDISTIQTIKEFNDEPGKGLWLRRAGATPAQSVNNNYNTTYSEIKTDVDYTKLLTLDDTAGHTSFYIHTSVITGNPVYPLSTQMIYIVGEKNEVLADRPQYEQTWRITFHTDSEVIIGGGDNGKCALGDFTVTLYLAPRGKEYYGDEGTHFDKKKEYKNCGE